MSVKLAEALLRRKELQGRVDVLKTIHDKQLFEIKGKRVRVNDDLDDVVAQVPLLTASQVMHEYNWHSRQLRLVDAVIQQANWTTMVELTAESMGDYPQQEPQPARGKTA